jgi:hypothetical protein
MLCNNLSNLIRVFITVFVIEELNYRLCLLWLNSIIQDFHFFKFGSICFSLVIAILYLLILFRFFLILNIEHKLERFMIIRHKRLTNWSLPVLILFIILTRVASQQQLNCSQFSIFDCLIEKKLAILPNNIWIASILQKSFHAIFKRPFSCFILLWLIFNANKK